MLRLLLPALLVATTLVANAWAFNENITVVLHGTDVPAPVPCDQYVLDGVDCETVLPRVDLSGATTPGVLMLLRNYDHVRGVQVAFTWPPSWVFTSGSWDCQVSQVVGYAPTAPGPTTGSIVTAFNGIEGGMLAPIGSMHFAMAGDGCLEIIESDFPFGNHVVGNEPGLPIQEYPISSDNWGRVCVGPGGYDACNADGAMPVEATTWGAIKHHYR